MPSELEETLVFVYKRLLDIYTHWLVTPRKRTWTNPCVLDVVISPMRGYMLVYNDETDCMCSPSQWCVTYTPPLYPTHHPLPNQQIWLQLAGGEDEAACAAQLRKTLNNLLNRWQCALIPHSAHSLHCLRKRKQHHTSLRFNRPATLWITCLVDEDSGARKSLAEAVRKSVWQWYYWAWEDWG